VRDDGALLALTFVEDQNTFAWTRCYIGGTFGSGASATGFGVVESICSIEGDEQDDVYLLIKRTVNSTTKRYIEKLVRRWDGDSEDVRAAKFLDSHVVFTSSASTSTVTGLWHLQGQSVYALVDGNVQGPFTVANGAITLTTALVGTNANSESKAIVGLSYTSEIVDLPLSTQTQSGAPQGRFKSVNAIVLKLNHTRGVSYGDYADTVRREEADEDNRMKELKERDVERWSDPIAPYSGDTKPLQIDGGWSLDGSIILRQTYPLPLEVTMIARDVTIGGP
jgi:hypothetical protein